MIWEMIIKVPLVIMTSILSLMSVWSLPDAVLSSIQSFFATLRMLDFILPMSTVITVVGLIMTFYVALVVWKISLFMYAFIRGTVTFDS